MEGTVTLPMPRRLTGHLALDFVNSIEWRGATGDPGEYLVSYEALLRWNEIGGALDADEVSVLLAAARERPADAQAGLAAAIRLREALALVLPTQGRPAPAALEVLNAVLAAAMASPRLAPEEDRYGWVWPRARRLEAASWPVARAAADLLTAAPRLHVRACANDVCGWLFIDESRGHRRRWCSMESCGNREKARRHYARTRGRPAAESA